MNMSMQNFKELYYDLLSVWEDVHPGRDFHIFEDSPQPAIAQLVNEYNEKHRTEQIRTTHDQMDWYIDEADCPRLFEWYREFIKESPIDASAEE